MRFLKWVATIALLALTSSAVADAPPFVQYSHKAWRLDEGSIPGVPAAISQTPDGYLWIGSATGLFRFDGLQFTKFVAPPELASKLSGVLSLLTDSKGTLWIGTEGYVFRYQDRKLVMLPGPIGRINGFVEDGAGQIWFSRSRPVGKVGGICRVNAQGAECFGTADKCPYGNSIALDRAGTISVGGASSICQFKGGVVTTIEPDSLRFTKELQGVAAMQVDADDSLLVGFYRNGPGLGLERLANGSLAPVNLPGVDMTSFPIAALYRDKQAGLWVGTETAGLLHSHDGRVDSLATQDGLSGTQVTTFFEDTSGGIWVGTLGGLDLFHKSEISSFGVRQGLATEEVPSVLALHDGSVLAGGAHGLSIVSNSAVQTIAAKDGLPGHLVTAMYQDPSGTLWLGVDDHLVTWRDGRFTIVNSDKGEPIGPIFSLTGGDDGSVWAVSVARPSFKLFRVEPGHVPQAWPLPEGVSSIHDLATDPRGNVWAANADGRLLRFDGHSFVVEAAPAHPDPVRGLFFNGDATVWSGTRAGLKGVNGGHWLAINHASGLPCDEVESMISEPSGTLWLDLQCGYFSVSTDQLVQFAAGKTDRIHGHLYAATAGARTGASTFTPGAARDSEQRLWFANDGPLQLIDVRSLPRAVAAPPVHIESISVDGRLVPLAAQVMLPALSRDITIGYAAIDFRNPLGVSYRYRLGDDAKNWTDVDGRRTALFSNLKPGRYLFKVTAGVSDDIWNDQGDSVEFIIPPTYYQTLWFRALIGVLIVLALWGLMALRLRRAAEALELRMRERLAERDRIARDLHDTLLQGIQSIVLRFQVVANAMREGKPADKLMLSSLSKADAIIVEIREKVQDLRVHGAKAGFLGDDLKEIFEDLVNEDGPSLHCVDNGVPRTLQPAVREELNAIAREVIFNAVQHSKASSIHCELRYSARRFVFVCTDDGIGIPCEVLKSGGKAGHWGLIGVKERADRLGASVAIESSAQQGTSVVITLSARAAYAQRDASLLSRVLCRLGLTS